MKNKFFINNLSVINQITIYKVCLERFTYQQFLTIISSSHFQYYFLKKSSHYLHFSYTKYLGYYINAETQKQTLHIQKNMMKELMSINFYQSYQILRIIGLLIKMKRNRNNLLILNYALLESRLGSGYSANVGLYKVKKTEELVAIKLYQFKNCTVTAAREAYENELDMLLKLRGNKASVQILGYGSIQVEDRQTRRPRIVNQYYIIMECLNGISLQASFEIEKSLEERKQIAKQLVAGLLSIHDLGIAHRDVNPNNIIITDGLIKFIDFTFSTTHVNKKHSDFFGTQPYVAPEIVDGSPYYPLPAEAYSVGVLLSQIIPEEQEIVQLLTIQNPYKRGTLNDTLQLLQ
ncbi:hypothetical protein pb186bvf_014954 [Paramecium bursaria]